MCAISLNSVATWISTTRCSLAQGTKSPEGWRAPGSVGSGGGGAFPVADDEAVERFQHGEDFFDLFFQVYAGGFAFADELSGAWEGASEFSE